MGCIEFTPEDLGRAPEKVLTGLPFDPHALAEQVAHRWGTTCGEMFAKSPGARGKHLLAARADLYAELRARRWSYPMIGKFCGDRDHTTVILALRRR